MTEVAVTTHAGPLIGKCSGDGQVEIFLGIPYAAPPVGERRWQSPQPVRPWQEPRRADAFGPSCMQASFPNTAIASLNNDTGFPLIMSEDCLYINVWAPRHAHGAPVLLWVHGGGNRVGSGATIRARGEALARKGVIVVTFNYRLGGLGFLAHPALSEEGGGASGNYALMDTLAALRWVSENIAAFGGDPARITLAGYSMAAFQVTALMANPEASRMFAQVICQSPMGCFNPLPSLGEAEKTGMTIADALGAPDLQALRAVPAYDVAIQPGIGAVIDGRIIAEPVKDAFEQGRIAPKPILVGYTTGEGTPFPAEPTLAGFRQKARETYGERADRFLGLYSAQNDAEALNAGHEVIRDAWVGTTARLIATSHERAASPVFAYTFNRPPPFAHGARFRELGPAERYGAYHGSDTAYWFENLELLGNLISPEDAKLADRMSTYWANFARTGDPNGEGLPEWPAFASSSNQVMSLDVEATPTIWPHLDRLDFFAGR